ncbi:MAG: DUF58 domain-containing protein [Hamadaea sp.]|uniref:DUF58 domain-containing protein n=1 Tax=Hamadaea sp. TaxID=2024425 RepID=UPI0017C7C4BD|nr:DUF58 domain-containing protein [Hamadaea sp.]NUR74223.1 DUF58 domain-containing protein [Hamadaea sp.]NUT22267.1 DUF58 domain-containing protein [Hamadaea sp.]
MPITPRGLGLGVGGVLLALTGIRFGYPELVVVGATAFVAIGCALAYGVWRPRLEVARSVDPDRVGRGEGSHVILTVRNTSRLLAASLVAEDSCGRLSGDGQTVHDKVAVAVPVLRLRAGATMDVGYPVPTGRRGVIQVGPLRVTRRDPLGLLSLGRDHGGSASIWVHPRIHPLQAVPAGVSRSMDGRIDRVPHGSITFDALREYVIGDELRHVHWRTSAKVGELMVREHLDTSLPRIVVLLDDRSGSYAAPALPDGEIAAFEAACEAAASVIAAAVREDLPVVLHTVGGRAVAGHRGSAQAQLDALAEVTPSATADAADTVDSRLANAANRLRQHRPGDTLVYLTGTGGVADLGLVGALRGAFPTVVTGILGPITPDEPQPGGAGMLFLRAEDGVEFAAEWEGVGRW